MRGEAALHLETLLDLAAHLNTEGTVLRRTTDLFDGGNLYKGHVNIPEGQALLFFDGQNAIDAASQAEELHADGTFSIRPATPKCAQIFVLGAIRFDHLILLFDLTKSDIYFKLCDCFLRQYGGIHHISLEHV